MAIRMTPALWLVPVVVAGLLAYFGTDRAEHAGHAGAPAEPLAAHEDPAPPAPVAPPIAPLATMPPNHPAVDPAMGNRAPALPAADDSPAIKWTMPSTWEQAPNPSSMRLATYKAPGGVEISVTRAGGGIEPNIQRWIGQFEGAGKETRSDKTVRGLRVAMVDVSGTYMGGGMSGSPESHAGWSLAGAIVDAPGAPYFFKMLGPAAAVKAARPALVTMLDGLSTP